VGDVEVESLQGFDSAVALAQIPNLNGGGGSRHVHMVAACRIRNNDSAVDCGIHRSVDA
jgi:hypothetical protein